MGNWTRGRSSSSSRSGYSCLCGRGEWYDINLIMYRRRRHLGGVVRFRSSLWGSGNVWDGNSHKVNGTQIELEGVDLLCIFWRGSFAGRDMS